MSQFHAAHVTMRVIMFYKLFFSIIILALLSIELVRYYLYEKNMYSVNDVQVSNRFTITIFTATTIFDVILLIIIWNVEALSIAGNL